MALFFEGMQCRICGKKMYQNDMVISFPPFVGNRKDPLYFFSDSTFHNECFSQHSLAKTVTRILEHLKKNKPPTNFKCNVCQKEILTDKEYFTIGYLTPDETNPLYDLMSFQCHKNCLPKWNKKKMVIDLLKELNNSGAWEGKGLENAILDLERICYPEK